jgi:hypothetical protein
MCVKGRPAAAVIDDDVVAISTVPFTERSCPGHSRFAGGDRSTAVGTVAVPVERIAVTRVGGCPPALAAGERDSKHRIGPALIGTWRLERRRDVAVVEPSGVAMLV